MNFNDHYLDTSRYITDPIADNITHEMFSGDDKEIQKYFYGPLKNKNPDTKNYPEILQNYFSLPAMPAWANKKLMLKGSNFFLMYAKEIMGILGYYSLPYCYAAANGAQVLYLSEKIRNNTTQRLTDTGKFVVEIMKNNAFDDNGNGVRACKNIRLRHAMVRYRISESGTWNNDWGKPINQEDMAGTNIAFSFITLRGLDKLGIYYSQEEANAFMHLWKVIGFLLGVDENLLTDNLKEAYWLDKSIRRRHFKKSEAGEKLTQALIKSFHENAPGFFSPFINPYLKFMLGDEVSHILGIKTEGLKGFDKIFINSLKFKNFISGSIPQSLNSTSIHSINLQLIN